MSSLFLSRHRLRIATAPHRHCVVPGGLPYAGSKRSWQRSRSTPRAIAGRCDLIFGHVCRPSIDSLDPSHLPAMWTSGVVRRMRASSLCWLECGTGLQPLAGAMAAPGRWRLNLIGSGSRDPLRSSQGRLFPAMRHGTPSPSKSPIIPRFDPRQPRMWTRA